MRFRNDPHWALRFDPLKTSSRRLPETARRLSALTRTAHPESPQKSGWAA